MSFSSSSNSIRTSLEEACEASPEKLTLPHQEGYDHSYYFISTFMQEHILGRARALGAA